MTPDAAAIPAIFWKDGYALIRGVFTQAEIEEFRRGACASRQHAGDLLSNRRVRAVLLDDRILDVAARILGDTPVYFGDSNCSFGDASHGYHKDNADRTDRRAPDWQGRYPLIRFGVYLQDHVEHSGGLNIRRGSHNVVSTLRGANVYLRTRVGDVVVWNLRTSHSGTGKLLRVLPDLHLPPRVADWLPGFLFAPSAAERVALFFTFGLPGPHLDRYLRYLTTRAYMVRIWRNSHYDDGTRAALAGKPLILLDVWSQVQHEHDLGRNEDYAPISY